MVDFAKTVCIETQRRLLALTYILPRNFTIGSARKGHLTMVSRVIPVDTFDLVIFGGTGDLARRKILPSLFRRYCAGQVPDGSAIIGVARGEMDDMSYRQMVADAVAA